VVCLWPPPPTPPPPALPPLYGPAAAATYGSNTTVQLATPGGPTVDGSNGVFPASGTQFAVLQTSLLYSTTSSGALTVAADTTANAQGGTLTYFNNDPPMVLAGGVTLTESGVGVTNGSGPGPPEGNDLVANLKALDYLYFGTWLVARDNSLNNFQEPAYRDVGAAIGGYETPVSAMPTSGSATYQGMTTGYVVGGPFAAMSYGDLGNVTTNEYTAALAGTASLTVNFATGGVSGSLTGMKAATWPLLNTLTGNPVFTWNNVTLTGTVSGNTISGTTSAANAPGQTYSLPSTATGTLKGGFYGPAAQTVGAVWTLAAPFGFGSAIGAIGATKTPSDRRLKRDVRLERVRADGLRIYSFRYNTDARRFTGVMAQDLLEKPSFAPAVSRTPSGLMVVDYQQIGLEVSDAVAMRAAGFAAIAAFERAHRLNSASALR